LDKPHFNVMNVNPTISKISILVSKFVQVK
jgi:hypothetical protein